MGDPLLPGQVHSLEGSPGFMKRVVEDGTKARQHSPDGEHTVCTLTGSSGSL